MWDRASWKFVYFSAGNPITTSVLSNEKHQKPSKYAVHSVGPKLASTLTTGVGLGTRDTRIVLVVRIGWIACTRVEKVKAMIDCLEIAYKCMTTRASHGRKYRMLWVKCTTSAE